MKTFALTAILALISSLSLTAKEPASFDGNRLTYTEGGQTFNFRRIGERQLMLMPGSYSGSVVIPAGIDTDDGLYTVTSIGPGALTGRWLKSVVIPHTVTTLENPFGDYTYDYAPLDSIRFLSRPLRFHGGISYGALAGLKEKRAVPKGERIRVAGQEYSVINTIPIPYLLAVADEKGRVGAITYGGIIVLPFEYEDIGYGCNYAAAARKDGKWGVVDYRGNVLIPFTYESEWKLGFGDKLGKKIDKAFSKLYKDDAGFMSGEISKIREAADLDYLLWISGYEEQEQEHSTYISETDMFLSLMYGIDMDEYFEDADTLLLQIDSLMDCGKSAEAKDVYRTYVSLYGFSAEAEDSFAKAGCLDYTSRDTVDMSWNQGQYSGQIDEFGIPHGKGLLRKEKFTGRAGSTDNGEEEEEEEYFISDTYRGLWIKGKIYGPCEMQRANVDVAGDRKDVRRLFDFSGYIVGDEVSGNAEMDYARDFMTDFGPVRYYGEISGWMRNGKGKARSDKNGWTYEGEWARDRWNGHGTLTYDEGIVIEGSFRNGEIFGEFVRRDPDGSVNRGTIGDARYLTVNDEEKIAENISHYSASRSYTVYTDWSSYEITGLPDWITVSGRSSSSFILDIAENPSRDGRSATVTVSAGGLSATIDITQEGDRYARSGSISNSWAAFNVVRNMGMYMSQGMEIHTAFSLDNLNGRQCQITVYFEFSNGQKLRDINSSFCTTDGYVSAYENFTPPYTSSLYNDYSLYIPYSELHLAPGQHQLRYYVCIFDMSAGNAVATSDYVYFSLTTW